MNQAIVQTNKALTHDVFELTLQTAEPITFLAGQFITIKIDDKIPPCFRAYSICSPPTNTNQFTLCVKYVPEGRGSSWLKEAKFGDPINFIGPNGYFTHQKNGRPLLFIATGTGIAPFYSIITELLTNNFDQPITLLFGVRHENDLFYLDHFENLATNHPNFTFITTLSQPSENWQGTRGRVTEPLKSLQIDPATDIYICGLTPMIDSVREILTEKNLPETQIHFEKYD